MSHTVSDAIAQASPVSPKSCRPPTQHDLQWELVGIIGRDRGCAKGTGVAFESRRVETDSRRVHESDRGRECALCEPMVKRPLCCRCRDRIDESISCLSCAGANDAGSADTVIEIAIAIVQLRETPAAAILMTMPASYRSNTVTHAYAASS